MPVPFDAVREVIADLEQFTPRYEPGVARVRVTGRAGERLSLLVQDTAGREAVMEARLRPGWCLMQSAAIVIAFAARPLGEQTLLAYPEHWRGPAPGPGGGAGRPAALAKIDAELAVIEGLAAGSRR